MYYGNRNKMSSFLVDPPSSLLPRNYGNLCPVSVADAPADIGDKEEEEEEFRVVTISKSSYIENKLNLEKDSNVSNKAPDVANVTSLQVPTTQDSSGRQQDYSKMSVKELKELCKSRKLKTTGKRRDLEIRLRSDHK